MTRGRGECRPFPHCQRQSQKRPSSPLLKPCYNGDAICGGAGRQVLLAMNVNNTNVTIGVFEGDSLTATWRFATDVRKTGDEYGVLMSNLLTHDGVSPDNIDAAVIGCVVPDLEPVFEGVCKRYFNVTPLLVGTGVRTGLRILYDSPREGGADRVAGAGGGGPGDGTPRIGLGAG